MLLSYFILNKQDGTVPMVGDSFDDRGIIQGIFLRKHARNFSFFQVAKYKSLWITNTAITLLYEVSDGELGNYQVPYNDILQVLVRVL